MSSFATCEVAHEAQAEDEARQSGAEERGSRYAQAARLPRRCNGGCCDALSWQPSRPALRPRRAARARACSRLLVCASGCARTAAWAALLAAAVVATVRIARAILFAAARHRRAVVATGAKVCLTRRCGVPCVCQAAVLDAKNSCFALAPSRRVCCWPPDASAWRSQALRCRRTSSRACLHLVRKLKHSARKDTFCVLRRTSAAAPRRRVPLGTNNLVTAHLQLLQSEMLVTYTTTAAQAATAEPHILAAHRAEFLALLAGTVEALERRRVAGTLLEGKCAAAEEAWRAGLWLQMKANIPAADVAALSVLVGYELFIRVATNCLLVLNFALVLASEDSTDAQFLSFAQHVLCMPPS